jgi:drug/metabolite transporter (DMT)-like permease
MKQFVWLTFGALCLLSASAWVIEPFDTAALPSLERQALLHLIVGLTSLLLSPRKIRSRLRHQPWPRVALASLGFFAIPAAAIEFGSSAVPQITRSALFALVPIVVVVALTTIETAAPEERSARRSLAPALVGLGGLLLLLPLNLSNSARSNARIAVLCVAVILVGIASVWLARWLAEFKLADAVAVVCLANAAVLFACAAVSRSIVWNASGLLSLLSWSSLLDILEILLLLWLLRVMPPIQFAARYLLIPLLTVLEGYVLLRPELTLRIGAGAILLATGVGLLLLQRPVEDEVVSFR